MKGPDMDDKKKTPTTPSEQIDALPPYHVWNDVGEKPVTYTLTLADLCNGIYCVSGMTFSAEKVMSMVTHILSRHGTDIGVPDGITAAAVEVADIPASEVLGDIVDDLSQVLEDSEMDVFKDIVERALNSKKPNLN